jgi:hypothetical protein
MADGENAGVAGDAFFGAVRRRHPDVDIVVLPQTGPAEPSATEVDPADLDDLAARFDAEIIELWAEVATGVARPATASRWVEGSVLGSVSREVLLAVEGVDAATAHQALAGAQRSLTGAGWHVLAPPTGMPRVLASRGEGAAERVLQVVYVEATSRFAVSCRTGSYVVGHDVVRAVVAGPS